MLPNMLIFSLICFTLLVIFSGAQCAGRVGERPAGSGRILVCILFRFWCAGEGWERGDVLGFVVFFVSD